MDVSRCTGIVTSFTFICMHTYSYSINRISFRQAIVTSRSTVDYIRWFSISFLLICAKCMYLLKFLIRYVDLVDMIDTNLCVLASDNSNEADIFSSVQYILGKPARNDTRLPLSAYCIGYKAYFPFLFRYTAPFQFRVCVTIA